MTIDGTSSRINCPKCEAKLAVPARRLSPYIRCGSCGALMHVDCDLPRTGSSSAKESIENKADAGEVSWLTENESAAADSSPSDQGNSNQSLNSLQASAIGPQSMEPIYLGPETGEETYVDQNSRQHTVGKGFRAFLIAFGLLMIVVPIVLSVTYSNTASRVRREARYGNVFTTTDMYQPSDPRKISLDDWKLDNSYPKNVVDFTKFAHMDGHGRLVIPSETDELRFSGEVSNEKFFQVIEDSDLLRSLHYSNGMIDKRFVAAIRDTKLFELRLEDCKWEGRPSLRFTHPAFRQLYKLSLAGTPVTLRQITDLFVCYELEELDLQRTNLNDNTIEPINQFVRLKKLDVTQTKVTAAGLANLDCQSLRELRISAGVLTSQQRASLKQKNPKLKLFLIGKPN